LPLLLNAKIFLVPEEFRDFRNALAFAKDGDTISICREEKAPEPGIYLWDNKTVYVGLRNNIREWRNLDFGNFKIVNFSFPKNPVPDSFPPGYWQGVQLVNDPDTLYDGGNMVTFDNYGKVWVMWTGGTEPTYRIWDPDSGWGEEKLIYTFYQVPGDGHVIYIIFDSLNTCFVSMQKREVPPPYESHIFYTTSTDGDSWSDLTRVDTCESHSNWWPVMGYGGGELWMVFFGGGPGNPYDVYATHWKDGCWEPEVDISPDVHDSAFSWKALVDVDSYGRPHVVYVEIYTRAIYYTYFDGNEWVYPVLVNDTLAESGFNAHISVDENDHIHIVWEGSGEIYYRRFDGDTWTEKIQVNEPYVPDELMDSHPWIVAKNDSNVWVTWIDWDEYHNSHIAVSYFNGNEWSPQVRMDPDSLVDNGTQRVILNEDGYPWVVWDAWPLNSYQYEVYYDRYIKKTGLDEFDQHRINERLKISPVPFSGILNIRFHLERKTYVSLNVYDISGRLKASLLKNIVMKPGMHFIRWDGVGINGEKVKRGVYFIMLDTGNFVDVKKLVYWGSN